MQSVEVTGLFHHDVKMLLLRKQLLCTLANAAKYPSMECEAIPTLYVYILEIHIEKTGRSLLKGSSENIHKHFMIKLVCSL